MVKNGSVRHNPTMTIPTTLTKNVFITGIIRNVTRDGLQCRAIVRTPVTVAGAVFSLKL